MPPRTPNHDWLAALVVAALLAAGGTWLWDLQVSIRDFRERITRLEEQVRQLQHRKP